MNSDKRTFKLNSLRYDKYYYYIKYIIKKKI